MAVSIKNIIAEFNLDLIFTVDEPRIIKTLLRTGKKSQFTVNVR